MGKGDGVLILDCGPVGDTMELRAREARLWVEIDEPWAGDTESGFGRNCQGELTPEQVRELIAFLTAWFADQPVTE